MKDVTNILGGGTDAAGPAGRRDHLSGSCHLAMASVRLAPRQLLGGFRGLDEARKAGAEGCCGSAGAYNVVQNEIAMRIL